jgi:TetR/AcrR family transcriptional regulator, cholesterol catabolism regulator
MGWENIDVTDIDASDIDGNDDEEESSNLSKSEKTRQRVLDAAAKVFREQGYASARLADIAELAGMKTGSLYYHFTGREELVAEILHLGIQTAWDHVRSAVDALPPDATALTRLATAVRAHTLSVLETSDYASAQARIVGQVPREIMKGHLSEQQKYGAYWNELIEAADRSGALRPGTDLFVAKMLVLGALNWTAEWFSPKRGASAAAVADQAVAMVLNGVAAHAREAEIALAATSPPPTARTPTKTTRRR